MKAIAAVMVAAVCIAYANGDNKQFTLELASHNECTRIADCTRFILTDALEGYSRWAVEVTTVVEKQKAILQLGEGQVSFVPLVDESLSWREQERIVHFLREGFESGSTRQQSYSVATDYVIRELVGQNFDVDRLESPYSYRVLHALPEPDAVWQVVMEDNHGNYRRIKWLATDHDSLRRYSALHSGWSYRNTARRCASLIWQQCSPEQSEVTCWQSAVNSGLECRVFENTLHRQPFKRALSDNNETDINPSDTTQNNSLLDTCQNRLNQCNKQKKATTLMEVMAGIGAFFVTAIPTTVITFLAGNGLVELWKHYRNPVKSKPVSRVAESKPGPDPRDAGTSNDAASNDAFSNIGSIDLSLDQRSLLKAAGMVTVPIRRVSSMPAMKLEESSTKPRSPLTLTWVGQKTDDPENRTAP